MLNSPLENPVNRNLSFMKIIFHLSLFFLSFSLFGQSLSPALIKNNPSIHYDHLANIDTVIQSYIAKNQLVGMVTLVVKDNQLVHYKGHGFADLATKKPMPANAIFRIMSQTKAITSLGILQLFEKGKLDLDQKISEFIPEFKNPSVLKDFNPADSSYTTVPAKREITFRDLLTHTSGIDYTAIGSEKMKAIYAKADIPSGLGKMNSTLLAKMRVLGTLPLAHQPGEKFTYGLNTDLLGCLIEVISGKNLDTYFKDHIFEPLGMKDSFFNLPAELGSRLATVYTEENGQIIPWSPTFRNINPNYPLDKKTYFSGGAGLSMSTFDYAIFLQMILNGGKYNGKQIIGRRTAELMISPQLAPGIMGDDNFGLGFSLVSEKSANLRARSKGSFSWGGYYGTTYWADPKEKLIVLIMTQHTPNSHGDISKKIENIIYGSLK
jgi:CubicO group peptidase (beta-lactamase class C family)